MPDADSPLIDSPLRSIHETLEARLVPFAGWRMPVQYSGITAEHEAVRNKVGIFDISHMGQFYVSGSDAASWLNRLLTNNCANLAIGEGQYTLMLNAMGGVIDDLIIYRQEERFLLVVNASMISKDAEWLQAHLDGNVHFEDQSNHFAGMAIQGPLSNELARTVFSDTEANELPPRNQVVVLSSGEIICRTGYTGEDGFELFCPIESGIDWFQKFLDAGATPCGLGARDTLRLEMGYPLNGNDLSPQKSPLEAGLGFFVDLDKGTFIGSEALRTQKASGLPTRLIALQLTKKGPPPRPHYPVYLENENLGETTSGGVSPSLGTGIAMAYLTTGKVKVGDTVELEIRGRRFPAEIVKKPFYRRKEG